MSQKGVGSLNKSSGNPTYAGVSRGKASEKTLETLRSKVYYLPESNGREDEVVSHNKGVEPSPHLGNEPKVRIMR